MSTKYVLQPDGSILKIDTTPNVTVSTTIPEDKLTNISKNIVEENFGESYRKSNFNGIKRVDLDSGEDTLKDNLINYVSSNKNFDFVNQSEERELNIPTFKNFRSFTDINNNTRMFANELELIGAHLSLGEPETLISARYLFFLDYILEIAGLITAIELVTLVTEVVNDNDIVESSMLSLGNYTFSTPDFISPYFLKVLNYPTKLSNTNDRLASFFLGLNLYLGGDEPIKGLADLLADTITAGLKNSILRVITATLLYTFEGLLQSGAKDNLLDLLIRKFQMQKYWHEEQLYKAKGQGSTEKLMIEFKYYYFKFAIERMHVGLKALNWKYYGLSYDSFAETPLTRVGLSKSKAIVPVTLRDNEGKNQKYKWDSWRSWTEKSQSIRNRALPQALQLPVSFLANKILNKNIEDLSEETPILKIDKSLEQNFVINKTSRIDRETVKLVEQNLETEYVPFYFHDIRTNEIIAFHAFIDNLTDNYSPEYISTSGFGRIDEVKNYVKTTRNIQMSFLMASTSPEDHDLMWYQVNKLVSMCYPQWSSGFTSNEKTFEYPFTQMPTASPLIRLRVGDIIKSNYSKQNLSRLHGIGNRKDIDEPLRNAIFNNEPLGASIKNVVKKFNELIDKSIDLYQEENKTINPNIEKSKIEIENIDNALKDLRLEIGKIVRDIDSEKVRIGKEATRKQGEIEERAEFLKMMEETSNLLGSLEKTNEKYYSSRYKKEIASDRLILQGEYENKIIELNNSRKSAIKEGVDHSDRLKREKSLVENQIKSYQEEKVENNKAIETLKGIKNKLSNLKSKSSTEITYHLSPGLYRAEKPLGGGGGVLGAIASFLDISEKSYRKIDREIKVELIESKSDFIKVKLSDGTLLFADKNKLRKSQPVFTLRKEPVKEIGQVLEAGDFDLHADTFLSDKALSFEFEKDESIATNQSQIDQIPKNLASNIMDSTTTSTEFNEVGKGLEGPPEKITKTVVNNPFTAAFESAQGKGLAGFITNLNIGGIMESPWETSRIGSKAPLMVKIDIGFAPIHDIPPGLDHDGMMRAPTYNVGRLMNELFDDVYEE